PILPAQQTNRINYQANLPQLPKNGGYKAAVFNSELMQAKNYVVPPAWSSATVTGTTAIEPRPVTATALGARVTPLVAGDFVGASLGNPGSLTLTINGTPTTVTFDNVGATAGNHINFDPATTTVADLLADIEGVFQTAGGP